MLVRDIEFNGERNRAIHILKSRGMAHSNQVREFLVTTEGVNLVDVYTGTEGMLTGSARIAQELKNKNLAFEKQQKLALKERELKRKRRAIEIQIDTLRAEIENEEQEMLHALAQEKTTGENSSYDKKLMGERRNADISMDAIMEGKSSKNKKSNKK